MRLVDPVIQLLKITHVQYSLMIGFPGFLDDKHNR